MIVQVSITCQTINCCKNRFCYISSAETYSFSAIKK
jgi:hypothetical protein